MIAIVSLTNVKDILSCSTETNSNRVIEFLSEFYSNILTIGERQSLWIIQLGPANSHLWVMPVKKEILLKNLILFKSMIEPVVLQESPKKLSIFIFFYRTVLLHSERIIYVYAFINLACTGLALDTLRIYSGPFSESTCWWYKFFKNFTSAGVQFGFNSTIVFRVNNSWQISQLLTHSAHRILNILFVYFLTIFSR